MTQKQRLHNRLQMFTTWKTKGNSQKKHWWFDVVFWGDLESGLVNTITQQSAWKLILDFTPLS